MDVYVLYYYLGVDGGAQCEDIVIEAFDCLDKARKRLDEIYEDVIKTASGNDNERYDIKYKRFCVKNEDNFSIDTGIFYDGAIKKISI